MFYNAQSPFPVTRADTVTEFLDGLNFYFIVSPNGNEQATVLNENVDAAALRVFLSNNREYLTTKSIFRGDTLAKLKKISKFFLYNKRPSPPKLEPYKQVWNAFAHVFLPGLQFSASSNDQIELQATIERLVKDLIQDLQRPSLDGPLAYQGSDSPILRMIVSHMPVEDLYEIALVSSRWRTLADEQKVQLINTNPDKSLFELGMKEADHISGLLERHGDSIKCLNFSLRVDVPEAVIPVFIANCPNLERFSYEEGDIEDDDFAALSGKPLTRIDVRGCPRLTDKALTYLEQMPLLHASFIDCLGISQAAKDRVQRMVYYNIFVTQQKRIPADIFEAIPLANLILLSSPNGQRALQNGWITPAQAATLQDEYLRELLSDDGILALQKKLLTADTAALLPSVEYLMLLLSHLAILEQKLITPGQAALLPTHEYLEELCSEDGQLALKNKLITTLQAKNMSLARLRVLLTPRGIVLLSRISPEKAMELPTPEHLSVLSTDSGLAALHKKLLTAEQAGDIKSAECLAVLLSDDGLQALEDRLLTPKEASLMPTAEHIRVLLSKGGLLVLRKKIITAVEAAAFESADHLEQLVSPFGTKAYRETLLTLEQIQTTSIECLKNLFSDYGISILREKLIPLDMAELLEQSGLLDHLCSKAGVKALRRKSLTLEQVVQHTPESLRNFLLV